MSTYVTPVSKASTRPEIEANVAAMFDADMMVRHFEKPDEIAEIIASVTGAVVVYG